MEFFLWHKQEISEIIHERERGSGVNMIQKGKWSETACVRHIFEEKQTESHPPHDGT